MIQYKSKYYKAALNALLHGAYRTPIILRKKVGTRRCKLYMKSIKVELNNIFNKSN